MASSLYKATVLLKQLIARERQAPNPRDLSGVLAGGTFRADGSRVLGYWPIERGFLEELLGAA